MKKLISAASALAMAASMAGSAIPFTTGAVDATKGVELRLFNNPDGSMPSTTIDCSEGDVTVPVAMYYLEDNPDTSSIRASWCVTSKDGNASNDYVLFSKNFAPGSKYFTSNQTVTDAAGKTYETNRLMGMEGEIEEDEGDYLFSQNGEGKGYIDTQQKTQNVSTAWGSVVWTKPITGYTWFGKTSDAYPMSVFNVTFAKGTPAGTYNIDFVNVTPDPNFPDVFSTMIEGTGEKYNIDKGNLTAKGVTITVAGEPSTNPTEPVTDPVTDPTEPPTQKPTDPSTTPGDGDVEINESFVVAGETVTAKPGEKVKIAFTLKENPKAQKCATIVFDQAALPAGITSEVGKRNRAFEIDPLPTWTVNGTTWKSETRNEKEDPLEPIIGGKFVEIEYTIPADIKAGEYTIDFERFHIVENAQEAKEWNATVIPGVIKIEGEPSTDPTTEPSTDPGTDPGDDVEINESFVVAGENVTAKPGEKVKVAYTLKENPNAQKCATIVFDQAALPAGITSEVGKRNRAFEIDPLPTWTVNGTTWKSETRNEKEDPLEPIIGGKFVEIEYTLPADIAPGEYTIDFERFHIVENAQEAKEWNAVVIPTVITVEGEPSTDPTDPVTDPTDPVTDPTVPTDPTEPSTGEPGTVLYGDVNVDEKVNIADVVVLNRYLNNKTNPYDVSAQGLINANCYNVSEKKVDEKDSLAIIQSLVHLNDGKELPWEGSDLK